MKILKIALFTLTSAGGLAADDEREIQYASEGAPNHITEHASFMKFDGAKFVLIKKGTNNFTCLVVREPKGRYEPSCLNEEAMRTVFFTYQMHMNLLYDGHSYDETYNLLDQAAREGKLPAAETASLVYMMSPNNKFYNHRKDTLRSSPVHQMYFYPKISSDSFSLKKGPPWLWQGFPNLSALIVVVEND